MFISFTAFHWRADDGVLDPLSSHQLKRTKKSRQSVGPPPDKTFWIRASKYALYKQMSLLYANSLNRALNLGTMAATFDLSLFVVVVVVVVFNRESRANNNIQENPEVVCRCLVFLNFV